MKNHHSYPTIILGGSDAARLRYTVHNNGSETEGFINFGEDGRYQAYVVDKYSSIPDAYKCVLHAFINNPSTDGLTIYDDDTQETISFVCKNNNLYQFIQKSCIYEISGLYQIIVYRCGMRGCIIQLMTFDDFKSNKEVI